VEVVSALAGSVKLALLPPAVTVEDALIVLRPRSAPCGSFFSADPEPGAQGTAAGGLVESSVDEGVKLIAGGLEALLQRLKIQARRIVIRLELPQEVSDHAIAFSLENVEYCGADIQAALGGGQELHLAKTLTFAGVGAQLVGPEAGSAAHSSLLLGGIGQHGCSGRVDLRFASSVERQAQPVVDIGVQLSAVELRLLPDAIVPVAEVLRRISLTHADSAGTTAAPPVPGVPPAPAPWGTRSFFEALLLPDGEGIVKDALAHPAGGITGQASDNCTPAAAACTVAATRLCTCREAS
jgi:hypothetical protein